MAYNPYYSGGWQSGEEGGTPITPDALNHMETGIENANALDATPTEGSTNGVQSGGTYTAIQQSTAKIGVITNDEKGQSVSVATGTFVTIASITLGVGKYIVTGDIAFDSTSGTGVRILILAPTETNTNDYTNSVLASGRADLSKTRIVEFNATTTMYLRAYHTIGSSTGVKGRIRAISIA